MKIRFHIKFCGVVFLLMANALLAGCSSHYFSSVWTSTKEKAVLAERYSVSRHYEWVVHPHDSVYLASAMDTQLPERPRQIYQFDLALRDAVGLYFPNSVAAETSQNLKEALKKARSAEKSLLFYPRLGNVIDKRNTTEEIIDGANINPDGEFGADRALFQVHIYEVRSGKLLDVSTVKARGKMFAGKNTLPTDLLANGAMLFVNELQLASREK